LSDLRLAGLELRLMGLASDSRIPEAFFRPHSAHILLVTGIYCYGCHDESIYIVLYYFILWCEDNKLLEIYLLQLLSTTVPVALRAQLFFS